MKKVRDSHFWANASGVEDPSRLGVPLLLNAPGVDEDLFA